MSKNFDVTFEQHPLELMNGQTVFDAILEGNLSVATKQEVVEWLWANRKLDDDQYRLAMSRINHIANKVNTEI